MTPRTGSCTLAFSILLAACSLGEPEVLLDLEEPDPELGAETSGGLEDAELDASTDDGDATSDGESTGAGDDEPQEPEPEPEPEGCPADHPVEIDDGCYPERRAYGFHLIHKDFEASWDAIAELAELRPEVLITSQNRPEWLEPVRWAQRTSPSYFGSGAEMADHVHAVLSDWENAPAVVLVDELRAEHIGAVAEFAARMREQYPQWEGRWGVWLVHGIGVSYAALQPAIDELLRADARLVAELYPAVSQYCAAGSTTAARDQWLASYYRGQQGSFPQPRFRWLVDRRTELGSGSPLSLAFGVTDTYLDRPGAEVFLDRMFYVWRHHSGFGSLLFAEVGGVGAYKWHDHGPTSRDSDFVASYQHYSVAEAAASRLGPVPCD